MKTNVLMLGVLLSGCALSSHAVKPSTLGTPSKSSAMLQVIDEPGPLTVETINSTDWAVPLSGLLNLDNEKAKAAGLKDHDEPIQVYFHVIRHPTKGTFIVDTGVEKALRDDPDHAAPQGLLKSFLHTERMKVKLPLGEWVANNKLDGVMLTHLHIDHVSGMPDVPHGTPIYAGPGETSETAFQNIVVKPNIDRELEGQEPISEWQFQADPDGRFDGVIDVFGDGSLWAILVPGHTPGSTAFVARTADGPVLLTGDTSHTAWGWQNEVEPGSFTGDQKKNAESLKKLRALAAEHPKMSVRLGHQSLQ
jgi:glyoxylase-like metal-dependent hydrolase (beta-lactamase superfamily II)